MLTIWFSLNPIDHCGQEADSDALLGHRDQALRAWIHPDAGEISRKLVREGITVSTEGGNPRTSSADRRHKAQEKSFL